MNFKKEKEIGEEIRTNEIGQSHNELGFKNGDYWFSLQSDYFFLLCFVHSSVFFLCQLKLGSSLFMKREDFGIDCKRRRRRQNIRETKRGVFDIWCSFSNGGLMMLEFQTRQRRNLKLNSASKPNSHSIYLPAGVLSFFWGVLG